MVTLNARGFLNFVFKKRGQRTHFLVRRAKFQHPSESFKAFRVLIFTASDREQLEKAKKRPAVLSMSAEASTALTVSVLCVQQLIML